MEAVRADDRGESGEGEVVYGEAAGSAEDGESFMLEKLRQVCLAFRIADNLVSYEELKTGNINRTYKVNTVKPDGGLKSYIVQEVNTYVFKNPVWVMENIDRVTEHIRAKHLN